MNEVGTQIQGKPNRSGWEVTQMAKRQRREVKDAQKVVTKLNRMLL